MKAEFVERDEHIQGALISLLSKNHTLFIGVPGTAKSMLTDNLCKRVEGAQYFQWLLTKFSTPEEIFGPVSLRALENDEYKRITAHKLPECHISFLDEIFKANSAILNSLLTVINERTYHNNGTPVKVPLQSLFGASNELPESEELGALYDRFMLRYVVNYISEDSNFKTMLKGNAGAAVTKLTLQELADAQAQTDAVLIPDEVLDSIIKVRNELKKEGVISSDRRFKFSLGILKAHAWLNGRTAVGEDDLPILQHVLWSAPTEIKTVQRVIMSTANPLLGKVQELLDQSMEIFKNCTEAVKKDSTQASTQGVEANSKFKSLTQDLNKLAATAKTQGRSEKPIQEALAKVQAMNSEILKTCLGLTV
jgi:MoxR-like ATPase